MVRRTELSVQNPCLEETLPEIDDRDDVVVEPAGLPLPDQTNEDLIPIDFIDLPLTDDEGDGL